MRAWQGDSTLLTESMTGDQGRGRITASGGVRTLWTPPAESVEEPEGTTTSPTSSPGSPEGFTWRETQNRSTPMASASTITAPATSANTSAVAAPPAEPPTLTQPAWSAHPDLAERDSVLY